MIAPQSVDSALLTHHPEDGQWESIVGAMKPGAHLLLFSNVKEHHLGAISAEDAGLEIRDTLAWVFSSENGDTAMRLIAMARKPLCGTVADNVLRYGTGGLNIDACRIGANKTDLYFNRSLFQGRYEKSGITSFGGEANWKHGDNSMPNSAGRWPANVILQDCPIVRKMFPKSESNKGKPRVGLVGNSIRLNNSKHAQVNCEYSDSGSTARFFYAAPTLNNLCSYLLRLITPPNGTILTNCDMKNLPKEYNYVTDCE